MEIIEMENTFPRKFQVDLPRGVSPLNIFDSLELMVSTQ